MLLLSLRLSYVQSLVLGGKVHYLLLVVEMVGGSLELQNQVAEGVRGTAARTGTPTSSLHQRREDDAVRALDSGR